YPPLKNQKDKTEQALTALVKSGCGEWVEVRPHGAGRPTREFRLLRASTSTQFSVLRGINGNSVDVDAANSRKITTSGEPKREAVSDELAAMPAGVFEL